MKQRRKTTNIIYITNKITYYVISENIILIVLHGKLKANILSKGDSIYKMHEI
jgi:hypothetical protein